MTTELQLWFNRLQGLNNLCICPSFHVSQCTNATGSTITCHCRSEDVAVAIRDLIRTHPSMSYVQYRNTMKDGGEQFDVILNIEGCFES